MFDPTKRITTLFNIDVPIIQAGMIWASGWRLASAVSNAGGLGTIGSGSMYPEVLQEHLQKCSAATSKPYAVNLPLLYAQAHDHIDAIIKARVPVVFTSAGNPGLYTKKLQDHGIIVVHVVSSVKFAEKAEKAGCDAIVAEGFEAGGHNGAEETTTMVLIPAVANAVAIPVIAAGGIASGRQMLAAVVLGASGVQIGSRFVASEECSSHINFKNAVILAKEGATKLSLKKLTPVRLLKNNFYKEVQLAEQKGASVEELQLLLGKGRAKSGMYNGDLIDGELEIGQVCMTINEILPAAAILTEVWDEYNRLVQNIKY